MNILSMLPQLALFIGLAGIIFVIVRRIPDAKRKKYRKDSPKKEKEEQTVRTVVKKATFIFKKKTGEWLETLKITRTEPLDEKNQERRVKRKREAEEKQGGKVAQDDREQGRKRIVRTSKRQKRKKQRSKKEVVLEKEFVKKVPEPDVVVPTPMSKKRVVKPRAQKQQPQQERPYQSVRATGGKIQEEQPPAQNEKNLIDRIINNPKDVRAYQELAEIYIQQGNKEDAMKALQEVLKLSPNDLMSEEKLNTIQEELKERK